MVGAITVQADDYYFRDRSRVPSGGGCHLLSKRIISKIIIYIMRHNILAPSQIRSIWRLNVVPNCLKRQGTI